MTDLGRFLAALFVVVAFCTLRSPPVWAAHCPTPTFTVTQAASLNWSAWQIPAASVTGIISSAGVTSGTGTQIYGTKAAGNYTVARSSSQTHCTSVTFSITASNCNASGCTLSAFRGSWAGGAEAAFPITSTTLPSNAGQALRIGATATYNNTVTAGVKAPTYTIGIRYNALADATYAQSAALTFDAPLSIDTVTPIRFGFVQASTAGNFTIDKNGTITAGGGGVWLGGTKNAGSMRIVGSATQTITISTGSYVASGIGGGVTLSAATCAYNNGVEAACSLTTQAAPTSAGKTLVLGVRATVNASQTGNSAATPSFTVTVTYT